MLGLTNNFAFSLFRRVYWSDSWIARRLTNLRRGRDVFSPEFDVHVDGFPRSANTFAADYLEHSQSGRLRVRKHDHLPSTIIHSVKLGKPVMLLLRHPRDCTVSHAIYLSSGLPEQVRFFRDFHRMLRPYSQHVYVALFDDVITNTPGVIWGFDQRFGLGLRHDYDPETAKRQAEEMVRNEKHCYTPQGELDPRRVSWPSKRRDDLKKAMQDELQRVETSRLFAQALVEFDFFASLGRRPTSDASSASQSTGSGGNSYAIFPQSAN